MLRLRWLAMIVGGFVLVAPPVLAQSSDAPSTMPDAPLASTATPSSAPAEAQPADWQSVIDHQVQAFRDHDAAAALSDAAKVFHDAYQDPAAFFTAIMTAGYQPIMESQSDSFGDYQMLAPDTVLQRVSFVGKDQTLYDAIYQMGHEEGGWRVEGVQLMKAAGMGV